MNPSSIPYLYHGEQSSWFLKTKQTQTSQGWGGGSVDRVLVHKYEDLSRDPLQSHKKHKWKHASCVSPVIGPYRQKDPGHWPASGLAVPVNSRLSEELFLSIGLKVTEENPFYVVLTSGLNIVVHTEWACTYTHILTHTHSKETSVPQGHYPSNSFSTL